MFGAHYFGAHYFGPHYFGGSGSEVVVPTTLLGTVSIYAALGEVAAAIEVSLSARARTRPAIDDVEVDIAPAVDSEVETSSAVLGGPSANRRLN